jgi:DNA gyrase subunit A
VERFLPDSMSGERVVQVLPLPEDSSIGLLSSDGRFKRLPIEEFQELSGRAATVLRLKEGVELQRVVPCREGQDLVVASSTGRMLRLTVDEDQLPLMGRHAQGPMLFRLLPGESVVGAASVASGQTVLLASRLGQLKRLPVDELRGCQRGDIGQIGLRFQRRDDALVDLCGEECALVGVTLNGADGRGLRLRLRDLPVEDTAASGMVLSLRDGESVRELVPLIGAA